VSRSGLPSEANLLQHQRVHVLRTRSNLTIERAGVNFIRGVVEGTGCLFKEVNLQHDFAHDASIILVVDGEVQPQEVALQIKSGKTYNLSQSCKIPVTTAHLNFWAKHDLPTLGVVYDPSEKMAYWVDLKARAKTYQRDRQAPSSVKYKKALWNRFDSETFASVLLQVLMHKAPTLTLTKAIEWSQDSDFDTHVIGVRTLLAQHFIEKSTWQTLIILFHDRSAQNLSHLVPAAFSKMLGNWDLSYSFTTAQLPSDVKEFAWSSVTKLGPKGIAKLLEFLDYDEGFDFSRGSLGQAFATIFEAQPDMHEAFRTIAGDSKYRETIRQMARDLDLAYSNDRRWYWG
jgi:hypothetical protein